MLGQHLRCRIALEKNGRWHRFLVKRQHIHMSNPEVVDVAGLIAGFSYSISSSDSETRSIIVRMARPDSSSSSEIRQVLNRLALVNKHHEQIGEYLREFYTAADLRQQMIRIASLDLWFWLGWSGPTAQASLFQLCPTVPWAAFSRTPRLEPIRADTKRFERSSTRITRSGQDSERACAGSQV